MSVHSKMTAIADKIRSLLGISGTMGLDAMATNLGTEQTNIANAFTAVGNKGGTVPSSKVSGNLASAIDSIPVGVDTSDADATASDILSGKTAYVDGTKITGTIATKTSSNLTASGKTVTVPAGYYASQATKSVSSATQATPGITVDDAGLITASATQSAGYVAKGTKTATKQLTVQAAQTITPGTSDKTIASGTYLTGTQTIQGDSNLVAANIKSGVSIFGVTGSHEGGVTVQRKSGTFTTSSSGTATVNCGFQPDLVYIYLSNTSLNSETLPAALCAAFNEGNTSKVLTSGMYGDYGVVQSKMERTTTGFKATVYNPTLTWELSLLPNYQLDYIAVKYT